MASTDELVREIGAELKIDEQKRYTEGDSEFVYFADDVDFDRFAEFVERQLVNDVGEGTSLMANRRCGKTRSAEALVLVVARH